MVLRLFVLVMAFAQSGVDMKIKECGNKPNCVSSIDQREKFKIEPLKVSTKNDFEKLKQTILSNMKRVKLVSEDIDSAHFVFTTKLMRYKDDLHLYYSSKEGLVHISSRSRIGYSDWGVNRERVEEIRGLIK